MTMLFYTLIFIVFVGIISDLIRIKRQKKPLTKTIEFISNSFIKRSFTYLCIKFMQNEIRQG